jgi:hypothetical protein
MPLDRKAIYTPSDTEYYENIYDAAPRCLRLIRFDGEYMIGSSLNREYRVWAADYQKMGRRD